jgi:hypothetical protein
MFLPGLVGCNGRNYLATVYIKGAKREEGGLKVCDTFTVDFS